MTLPRVPRLRQGIFLLVFIALPLVCVAGQAPVTFGWQANLDTVNTLSDPGTGPEVDMLDSASLGFTLDHALGRGIMSYRLGGQIQYAPQRIAAGAPAFSAITAYPVETGLSYELPPPSLIGLWFRATLGRLALEEPTGLLLEDPTAVHETQLSDGLLLEFRLHGLYGSLGAGYLGLLDRRLNRVRFTPQDFMELADSSQYFAPSRGLAVLRLEAEDLFGGQSVGLFGIGQKDFRGAPPTFDSWYMGTVVSGPIAFGFRHSTSVVAAIAVPSPGQPGLGILLASQVAYRLPGNLLHEAWFSLIWASSQGGGLTGFPQLAGPPVSVDFAVPLTDIVSIELGIDTTLALPPAVTPLRVAFTSQLLLEPSGQLPAGYSFRTAGPFVGTDLELSARYEPIEGLRFDARAGTLITLSGVLPTVRLEGMVTL
ncbi:MAG: hypothetical protein ACHQ1F_01555 [Spirochaetia bacterium]